MKEKINFNDLDTFLKVVVIGSCLIILIYIILFIIGFILGISHG